ncbi:hypothetical protein [Halorhodospira sp. 9622]|uniref:hypothetical protein n=1 Tax=Halorhodospira sp. 9622 TaxID=2899136 RepID=UPI001EE7BA8F|nr:hypothetical protein [Halorhodospira sp. 9622]MCG5537199.1 hypothetical protein [Halorhodospira sp. 9622]
MHRRNQWLCAGVAAALLAPAPLFAAGVGNGIYLEFGGGTGEFEWDDANDSEDIDAGLASFGYALDTAPLGPRVFNYRLNVGLASQNLDFDDNGVEADVGGIQVDNIFGFRIISNDRVRWWAGPSVRVGLYGGDYDADTDWIDGEDLAYFEFALGGATGVNIDLGGVILSPSVAWRSHGFAGSDDVDGWGGIGGDFSGNHQTMTFNTALLF